MRVRRAQARSSLREGFSVIELTLASVVFLVLLLAFGRSLTALIGSRQALDADTRLQDMGMRAIERMLDELRRAGFVQVDGLAYPHLFEDGAPGPGFEPHAHPPAIEHASPGQADHGPNREIVFLLPADDDGDGVPDIDLDGRLLWSEGEVSFVLLTGADGVNSLQRRVDVGAAVELARDVERILVDDAESSGFAIPLNVIRIQLWFRTVGDEGRVHRHFVETTTRLRNSTGG
jgi:hypothetical protein